jgi:DNA-binding transcriptional ArsR family regulator
MRTVAEPNQSLLVDQHTTDPLVGAQSPVGVRPAKIVAEMLRAKHRPAAELAAVAEVAERQIRRNLVRSLRSASADKLAEEAQEFATVLANTDFPGDLDARWTELLAVWNMGVTMRDSSAVEAILRGNNDKNRVLMRLLKQHGESARKDLAAQVDLSDSHLSHALAQLEQAGLIERRKQGNAIWVKATKLGFETLNNEPVPKPEKTLQERFHRVVDANSTCVSMIDRVGSSSKRIAA